MSLKAATKRPSTWPVLLEGCSLTLMRLLRRILNIRIERSHRHLPPARIQMASDRLGLKITKRVCQSQHRPRQRNLLPRPRLNQPLRPYLSRSLRSQSRPGSRYQESRCRLRHLRLSITCTMRLHQGQHLRSQLLQQRGNYHAISPFSLLATMDLSGQNGRGRCFHSLRYLSQDERCRTISMLQEKHRLFRRDFNAQLAVLGPFHCLKHMPQHQLTLSTHEMPLCHRATILIPPQEQR